MYLNQILSVHLFSYKIKTTMNSTFKTILATGIISIILTACGSSNSSEGDSGASESGSVKIVSEAYDQFGGALVGLQNKISLTIEGKEASMPKVKVVSGEAEIKFASKGFIIIPSKAEKLKLEVEGHTFELNATDNYPCPSLEFNDNMNQPLDISDTIRVPNIMQIRVKAAPDPVFKENFDYDSYSLEGCGKAELIRDGEVVETIDMGVSQYGTLENMQALVQAKMPGDQIVLSLECMKILTRDFKSVELKINEIPEELKTTTFQF